MESDQTTQVLGDATAPGETDADLGVADGGTPDPPASAKPPTVGQLRRERKRLWDERQEAMYHIGGLALDLEKRDRLPDGLIRHRVEVIKAMDLRVEEIDAQLTEIDDRRRRGHTREPDPTGYCMSCGAPHLADANFCARCGARVQLPVDDGDTQVIEVPQS